MSGYLKIGRQQWAHCSRPRPAALLQPDLMKPRTSSFRQALQGPRWLLLTRSRHWSQMLRCGHRANRLLNTGHSVRKSGIWLWSSRVQRNESVTCARYLAVQTQDFCQFSAAGQAGLQRSMNGQLPCDQVKPTEPKVKASKVLRQCHCTALLCVFFNPYIIASPCARSSPIE
jgi:hypothetical protein